ncbi:hypothetical protein C8R44DRAFT_977616, partial [Mycena epipterygia]
MHPLAAVLCSKSMYSVFAAHSHSIVKAVASNLIGPALLFAINVIRHVLPVGTPDAWVFGHADPEPTEGGALTPEDTRKLSKNAVVVNTFQNIFSFRHKDRRSEYSKLRPAESLHFTRELYRIMLFASLFPGRFTLFIDEEGTEEEEKKIRVAWKEFLAVFPTLELCEIYIVNNFIEALAQWFVDKVRYKGWVNFEHAIMPPP